MLTVQERCTWCCWVIMMANGVRALPTSSRAWVSDTSVLRKIRSTTIPKSRTLRPTVSAYSLQLFPKQRQTGKDKHAQERYEMKHSQNNLILVILPTWRIETEERGDILLGFVYDDHRAVNGTVAVVASLQFFVVLSVQFITTTLFWSNTVI